MWYTNLSTMHWGQQQQYNTHRHSCCAAHRSWQLQQWQSLVNKFQINAPKLATIGACAPLTHTKHCNASMTPRKKVLAGLGVCVAWAQRKEKWNKHTYSGNCACVPAGDKRTNKLQTKCIKFCSTFAPLRLLWHCCKPASERCCMAKNSRAAHFNS